MTNRYRTVCATAGTLLLLAALTACSADRPEASDSASPPAATSAPAQPQPGASPAPPPAPQETTGTSREPQQPGAGGKSKVELPPAPAGAPTARKVVDAFKAAGLPAANPKDGSADCGPDGLGLGCSDLVNTSAVAVYVFPDATGAEEIATTWGETAHHRGVVVLRYATATPKADRPKYEKVLAGLV